MYKIDTIYIDDIDAYIPIQFSDDMSEEKKLEIAKERMELILVPDDERTSRDLKMRSGIVDKISKAKTTEDVVKQIKSAFKFTSDEMFPYFEILEAIKEKNIKETTKPDTTNLEELLEFAVYQTIKSLEEHYTIHPKIKVFILEIQKRLKKNREEESDNTTEEPVIILESEQD